MREPALHDGHSGSSQLGGRIQTCCGAPCHYRGRDGGSQDHKAFATMLDSASKVEQGNWYGKGKGMISG